MILETFNLTFGQFLVHFHDFFVLILGGTEHSEQQLLGAKDELIRFGPLK